MMARPWGRPRCPLLSGNNAGPAIAAINAPTATGNPALSDRIGSTAFSKKAWMRAADGASSCTDFSGIRSEEHTSELQSLMRISYAVFCLKKKKLTQTTHHYIVGIYTKDLTHIESTTKNPRNHVI